MKCKFCEKECKNKNSLTQHENRCKNNPNRILVSLNGLNKMHQINKINGPWNKGLTAACDDRVKRNAEHIKGKNGWLGKKHSEETKKKISEALLKYNHGDNKRNLHSKGGYYNGIYFMSTWELAYYLWAVSNNIKIIRCTDRFKYFWENSEHYYTPDFIVDDEYVEIKGKEWPKDLFKYEAVRKAGYKLKVLYYSEIKPLIAFVLEKYNINKITDLYQKV